MAEDGGVGGGHAGQHRGGGRQPEQLGGQRLGVRAGLLPPPGSGAPGDGAGQRGQRGVDGGDREHRVPGVGQQRRQAVGGPAGPAVGARAGHQGRQVGAGGGGGGVLGGTGESDRVGGAGGEGGGGGAGQPADHGDQVDGAGAERDGEAVSEDPVPVRAQLGDSCGAQEGCQLAARSPVFGAGLVEEQAAAGEPGGGAAGGVLGGPVEGEAGEDLAVRVGVVDEDGPAETEERAVAGGREQGEQHGVAAEVDRAVGGAGGHFGLRGWGTGSEWWGRGQGGDRKRRGRIAPRWSPAARRRRSPGPWGLRLRRGRGRQRDLASCRAQ